MYLFLGNNFDSDLKFFKSLKCFVLYNYFIYVKKKNVINLFFLNCEVLLSNVFEVWVNYIVYVLYYGFLL